LFNNLRPIFHWYGVNAIAPVTHQDQADCDSPPANLRLESEALDSEASDSMLKHLPKV